MSAKFVLIVDDEENIRDIIKDYIEVFDPTIKVIEASDGVEAYSKITKQRFDLVITDLGI